MVSHATVVAKKFAKATIYSVYVETQTIWA